jgi:hypothetical protein
MRNGIAALIALGIFFGQGFQSLRALEIVYPSDAGVLDITKTPYNADNNGTIDVSAIITKAMADHKFEQIIVYLPIGTYKVTNTIT